MLKKLTKKDFSTLKRGFRERRALDSCSVNCKIECLEPGYDNYSMYWMVREYFS